MSQDRAVAGTIYSCMKDGVRHFTARPIAGATDCQQMPYRYVEHHPGVAAAAPNFRGRAFGRYHCTSDCSGHLAGYEWAERRGVTSRGECSGNSQSFIEGCWAYAEEQGDE